MEAERVQKVQKKEGGKPQAMGGGSDGTPGEGLPFAQWYRERLGSLPVPLQVLLWVLYGFLWIPAWWKLTQRMEPKRRRLMLALVVGGCSLVGLIGVVGGISLSQKRKALAGKYTGEIVYKGKNAEMLRIADSSPSRAEALAGIGRANLTGPFQPYAKQVRLSLNADGSYAWEDGAAGTWVVSGSSVRLGESEPGMGEDVLEIRREGSGITLLSKSEAADIVLRRTAVPAEGEERGRSADIYTSLGVDELAALIDRELMPGQGLVAEAVWGDDVYPTIRKRRYSNARISLNVLIPHCDGECKRAVEALRDKLAGR